ncbi:hypothetical protein AAZX31_10G282000 [Glycine max]
MIDLKIYIYFPIRFSLYQPRKSVKRVKHVLA